MEIVNKKADLNIVSVFQVLQEIPFDKKYWNKNKINFDKIYLDLIKSLIKKLNLKEYRQVKVNIDNRKYNYGALGKRMFKKKITDFAGDNYPDLQFKVSLQPSNTDILIELADFMSSIFYRAYIENDSEFFNKYKYKIIQLKNPLQKADFL